MSDEAERARVKARIAELQAMRAGLLEDIKGLRSSIAKTFPDPDEVIVFRRDGETGIRWGPSIIDDTECDHCGERTSYVHLPDLWFPSDMEETVIAALMLDEHEQIGTGTRVIARRSRR